MDFTGLKGNFMDCSWVLMGKKDLFDGIFNGDLDDQCKESR